MEYTNTPYGETPNSGRPHSTVSRPDTVYLGINEKNLAIVDNIDLGAEDEESQEAPRRPFLLTHSVMVGLAMGLLVVIEALAIRLIVIQVRALGPSALPRLGLLATLPIFMWYVHREFGVFFKCLSLIAFGNLGLLFSSSLL